MPAEFIIDVEHRVIFSIGTGLFTSTDFKEHMERLRRASDFNPDFNQIVDCRGITCMDLNSEQVRDLAGQSIFSNRSRRAFVVSSDLQFGLSRMFSAYREAVTGQEVRVFRTMPEALAWLDLPLDVVGFSAEKDRSTPQNA